MFSPDRTSVIVSVYRDAEALGLILSALERQSRPGFELLVSEDGEAPSMAALVAGSGLPRLRHLTQPDLGFRKNRALNRAVLAAAGDYLIFLDGDCVPQRRFVEMHLACAHARGCVAGRRVELGPGFSARLRREPGLAERLERPLAYLRHARALHADGVKNYEFGLCLPWAQRLAGRRPIHLVGSNFSLPKALLLAINGFDERYQGPGLGEDADPEWRLRAAGFGVVNAKFVTPNFHLYHPRSYAVSAENRALFAATCASGAVRAERGLAEAAA